MATRRSANGNGSGLARTSSVSFSSVRREPLATSTIVLTLPHRTAYSSPTLQSAPPSRFRERIITGRRNLVPLTLAVDAPASALNRAGTLITPPRVVGTFVRSIATPQPGFGRRSLSSLTLTDRATLEGARPHSSLGLQPSKIDLQGSIWRSAERPRTPPGEFLARSDDGDPGYCLEVVVDSLGLPTQRMCVTNEDIPRLPSARVVKSLHAYKPPSPGCELASDRIFEPTPHRHVHIQQRQESMRKLLGTAIMAPSASQCLVASRVLSPVLVQLRVLDPAALSHPMLPHQFQPLGSARSQTCCGS